MQNGSSDRVQEDVAKRVGTFMRLCRNEAGLTQREVGEILDVGGGMVSHYELGSHRMPLEYLAEFCRHFDVEPNEVFGWKRQGAAAPQKPAASPADNGQLERYQKTIDFAIQVLEQVGNGRSV